MKVLLVDDSGVMRKIISRCLASLGVSDVTEAADGVEAWAAFQKEEFEFVITDWNMPNMNGLELIREIRTVNTDVPVIMVTTEGEKAKVLEAIQAGVTDYLCKPFEKEELQAKLDKYVPA